MWKLGCGCAVLVCAAGVLLAWLVVVMIVEGVKGVAIPHAGFTFGPLPAVLTLIGAAVFPDFLFEVARSAFFFLHYLFTGRCAPAP
jgi:uncharacterized integral membrane protein